jgi:hypothetical protein
MLSLEVVRPCGSLSVTFSFDTMTKYQLESSLAGDRGKAADSCNKAVATALVFLQWDHSRWWWRGDGKLFMGLDSKF